VLRRIVLVLLAPALALAGDAQLALDHAVLESDHVVAGSYRAGSIQVEKELKGKLAARKLIVAREDLEPKDEDLAPGARRLDGKGVFFLLGRFDGSGEDARNFIVRDGTRGVAWEGSVAYLGYRPGEDERLLLADIASREDFERLLSSSLAKEKALDAALAEVDSKARAKACVALVESARPATKEELLDPGPDPFALRALAEIGHLGELDLLDELRAKARHDWLKPACVRAMAPAPGSEKRLEAIARDKGSSEEEVVAAIDMLFSSEKADVGALEKLAEDPRARVRRAVASALREKVKDLGTLEHLMKDEDQGVRDAARDSARAAARRLGLPLPD
jgi:hypothetical protein